jgi:DNA/RNA-binding domain of Phe-tRNA-synthetase-like protein
MPEASADDVYVEIDTHLDDSDITDLLQRLEREWQREYDPEIFEDSQHIQDFEAVLAALRIVEGRDRRAEEATSGRSSTTYEASEIANLRKRVRRADPGDEFGHAGSIRRNDDRHISST